MDNTPNGSFTPGKVKGEQTTEQQNRAGSFRFQDDLSVSFTTPDTCETDSRDCRSPIIRCSMHGGLCVPDADRDLRSRRRDISNPGLV